MSVSVAPLIQRERGRIRRFLGLDIPERDLDLRFDLLPPAHVGKKPPGGLAALAAGLQAHRTTPREIFEYLATTIRSVNRHAMSARRRFELNEALAHAFYTEAAAQIVLLATEGGGIPESKGRRELLELFERIVASLTEGYQILFASDYRRRRFWYARVRERAYRCACRVLELIWLGHRIRALRYMPPSPDSWRIANTVFIVMRPIEQVDRATPTLAAHHGALGDPHQASLQDLFCSIQAYQLLDYSAWPEQGQSFIHKYCGSVEGGIQVLDPPTPAGTPGTDQLVTRCYQDRPPEDRPTGDDLGPALLIDYHALANAIKTDFAALSRARADPNRFSMPPRLARCEPAMQTAIGFLLHRNLGLPGKWGDVASEQQQHRDLRVYTGFQEVRAHLLSIFSSGDRLQKSRDLSNVFARRSAMIGEDGSAANESLWYLLYETEEQMRIKTQETRFTNRMFIGNLLAYGFGHDEVFRPRIGKVNRIYRPAAGFVVIDIEKLASYATPIALHKRVAGAHGDGGKIKVIGKPLPALLIHHPRRGWGIVTPPQETFWEKTPVGIQTGKRVTLTTLGQAQDLTAEFCWFGVSSSAFPERPPAYPEKGPVANELDSQFIH